MAIGPLAVPQAPKAAPMSGKASEEFSQLKHSLSDIASWEISPNGWDRIQIAYATMGNDKQAKSLIAAIELSTPDM